MTELQELFRAEAAAADMIIVSSNASWDLPALVATLKDWLPDCRRQRPGALVALLAAEPGQADAVEALICQLEDAAVASRMDFFVNRAKEVKGAEMAKSMGGIARQFTRRRTGSAAWIAGPGG